jgi:hypothetical protein
VITAAPARAARQRSDDMLRTSPPPGSAPSR